MAAIANAFVRSFFAGRPLPPGDFVHIDFAERSNRLLILQRSKELGPIFKGLTENRVVICVTDGVLARRMLKEHSASLVPVAIDLSRLEPAGFMRQMQGQTHRRYRRELVDALQARQNQLKVGVLQMIALDELDAFAAETTREVKTWASTLSSISTGMLAYIVFGAIPGSPLYKKLIQLYGNLGPKGVVWTIGPKQAEAFQALRREVIGSKEVGGVCGELARRGSLDDTMLANLIYMVELGRYDMRGLFRWISKFAGQHPCTYEEIATEQLGGPATEAFVTEVLRLEQSERLMRNVTGSFAWEGMLIPKGALLRVCMWEEHKRPEIFEDPFEFRPDRFLNGAAASFSPFGLDHHRCPFASQTILIGSVFLRTLARNFHISISGGEPPARGPYHWEPAPDFSVKLTSRGTVS